MDLSVRYELGPSGDAQLLPRTLRVIHAALPGALVHLCHRLSGRPSVRLKRYESPLTDALRPFFVETVRERISEPNAYKRMGTWWRYRLEPGLIDALVQHRPTPYAMPAGERLEDVGVIWKGTWLLSFVDHDSAAYWWWSAKDEAIVTRIGWMPPRARR